MSFSIACALISALWLVLVVLFLLLSGGTYSRTYEDGSIACGIPVFTSDFLVHGYLDHHDNPTAFTVDQLSDKQYAALLQFVDSYFARGYEYFTPMALRDGDRQTFETRYRTG